MKIGVILSSVRPGRSAERVGHFLQHRIKTLGHEPILIDPLQHKLPLLNGLYAYMDPKPPALKAVADLLEQSDAFIVCSAEYNHSIPPALTNLMSYYRPQYTRKPTGICTYSGGPFGGVRAAMQLRAFLAELGTITIPRLFPLPTVQNALQENGVPVEASLDLYNKNSEDFIKELVWYAEALKAHNK